LAIATWGSKSFEVSRKKVYTPGEITQSEAISVEEQEIEGKKPATYIKGLGLRKLSFPVKLDARFVDCETEINWWFTAMNARKPQTFTLGGKPLSSNKFLLLSVDVTEKVINKNGVVLIAEMSLQFSEYSSAGYKKQDDTTITDSDVTQANAVKTNQERKFAYENKIAALNESKIAALKR